MTLQEKYDKLFELVQDLLLALTIKFDSDIKNEANELRIFCQNRLNEEKS